MSFISKGQIMTENVFNGKQLEMITTEAEAIDDYSSVGFWVNGKEVDAEDVKMVVYVEDEELEKFECEDCGCYFMVKDRDGFDCPNCSSDANVQTLQVGDKIYSVKEYKAGEFGIYDENDKLHADCFKSVEHAHAWLLEQFAKNANEILKSTEIRAVITETSELYGENGDVDEDDPYYMQPMYEGYLEDIENEEEIDDTRTGRYCSLESVSDELEGFAQERKIGYMAFEVQKLVGTRWRDQEHLEKHLSETFQMQIKLQDSEADLVRDYAFIGSIFEDYGYMDIYYLKIPFNTTGHDETIYITEIAVSAE